MGTRACVLVLLAAILLAGCDLIGQWRDSQVERSHKLAKGSEVTPPAPGQELADAADYDDKLPLQKEWPIVEFSETSDNVRLVLLAGRDTAGTAMWVLGRLKELGYATDDNPSRLLEGGTFAGEGKYKSLYVKVTENTAGQCTVELAGTE
jgi:hypothetical protein